MVTSFGWGGTQRRDAGRERLPAPGSGSGPGCHPSRNDRPRWCGSRIGPSCTRHHRGQLEKRWWLNLIVGKAVGRRYPDGPERSL